MFRKLYPSYSQGFPQLLLSYNDSSLTETSRYMAERLFKHGDASYLARWCSSSPTRAGHQCRSDRGFVFRDWQQDLGTSGSQTGGYFEPDRDFVLSVARIEPKAHGSTDDQEDVDGPDYDDDYAIDPHVLCSIRLPRDDTAPPSLPPNVIQLQDDLAYTGDENLTDNDAEGEVAPEYIEID